MSSKRILIVEDELTLRELLEYVLSSSGFNVTAVDDIAPARKKLLNKNYDLIILDWMLPTMSGKDYTAELRSKIATKTIPIILLTAKAEENDRLAGFAAGADDYITKPFSTKELIARVKALLRRSNHVSHEVLNYGGLSIDLAAKRITFNEINITLSPIEYKLLVFLASNKDRVYSRDQLLSNVWGVNAYLDERTVDVHMRRLRSKLKPYALDKTIETVRGSGYRFKGVDDAEIL